MSLLVRSEMLGMPFHKMTDNKYSRHYRDNFTLPVQLQISNKQKICSQFFITYLKST